MKKPKTTEGSNAIYIGASKDTILASAADFERRCQQLPHVCISAGKTTSLDSPNDACREAAEDLCWHPHRQHQGFSLSEIPDNPAEDFTCAAARTDL